MLHKYNLAVRFGYSKHFSNRIKKTKAGQHEKRCISIITNTFNYWQTQNILIVILVYSTSDKNVTYSLYISTQSTK